MSIDWLMTEGPVENQRDKKYWEQSCWQRGSGRQSKWILSKTQLMITEAYHKLWLIYALHGSSCLLMQLFTYLVHMRIVLFSPAGCVFFFGFFWLVLSAKKILENIVASAWNTRACLWLKYEETLTVSVQENHQKIWRSTANSRPPLLT